MTADLKPVGIKPLDPTYLPTTFAALGRLEVQLDSDPLVYGPKRLNLKTALVRKMLTECERLFLDISQKHAYYKRAHRAASLILDMSLKHLLANDPETRAGRAVSEREATAYGKLKVESKEVSDAQDSLEELEAIMAVVKAKRSDLRDIQGRLRDQVRLCQEEIGLGSRWGSKSPRGVELQPGQGFADGSDVAAIDDLIANVRSISDAEQHLKAVVDDTDDTEAEEAALLASAEDLEGDGDLQIAPRQAPSAAPKAPLVFSDVDEAPLELESLQVSFGFNPHCEVCGEAQFMSPGGITCPRGHGGAGSVPPAGDALEEVASETAAAVILPGTADSGDISDFLMDPEGMAPGAPRLNRFQVEEEDGLGLDSLLASFK